VLETNSENRNIRDLYRGINQYKKDQPITKIVKDDSGVLLADSSRILNIWKTYFCQLWSVHVVNDVG
jgi:hypothetical protein